MTIILVLAAKRRWAKPFRDGRSICRWVIFHWRALRHATNRGSLKTRVRRGTGGGTTDRNSGPEAVSDSLPAKLSQSRPFMHGNMIGLIALDFILRLVLSGVMRVALVIRVLRMDLYNPAADMPGLGIPRDVIAHF